MTIGTVAVRAVSFGTAEKDLVAGLFTQSLLYIRDKTAFQGQNLNFIFFYIITIVLEGRALLN